jgi:PAS domain S-box-containing protein
VTLLARLLLLVTVALLPALDIQLYSEIEAGEVRDREVHAQALRLARLVASEYQNLLEGAQQMLATLGRSPAVTGRDAAGCHGYLSDLLQEFPRYAALSVTDRDGQVVCTVGDKERDISEHLSFRLALSQDGFSVAGGTIGRSPGRPSMSFSEPYRDWHRQLAGVIRAELDFSWLAEHFNRFALPQGSSAAVLDRSGAILARWPAPESAIGQTAPDEWQQLLSLPREGTRVALGADGTRRVFGYVPLDEKPRGLIVAVGLDASVTFAEVVAAKRWGIILIAAGILLALLITTVGIGRLVSRPTEALLDAAQCWRNGDLEARVGPQVGGRSEFGQLAVALDRMAETVEAREQALRDSEERFRLLVEGVVDHALLMLDPAGRIANWNRGVEHIHGWSAADVVGQPHEVFFTQEDRVAGKPAAALNEARRKGIWRGEGIRVRHDGSTFWAATTLTALLDSAGHLRGFAKITRDVTERRRAEELKALLMREVDHRAKNVLAVALSLLRLTSRDDAATFATSVEGRVFAMARAHSLLAKESWKGVDLRSVAESELAALKGQVQLDGPSVRLVPDAVQPVAMLLHELASNAAKYGALCCLEGRATLSWTLLEDRKLLLRWVERGGLPVREPPARRGFGLRLMTSLARQQLGGSITFDWDVTGLACTILLAPRFVSTARPHAVLDRSITMTRANAIPAIAILTTALLIPVAVPDAWAQPAPAPVPVQVAAIQTADVPFTL